MMEDDHIAHTASPALDAGFDAAYKTLIEDFNANIRPELVERGVEEHTDIAAMKMQCWIVGGLNRIASDPDGEGCTLLSFKSAIQAVAAMFEDMVH